MPNVDFPLLHDIDCELLRPLELDQSTTSETSLNQTPSGVCYLKTIGHNLYPSVALYSDTELRQEEPASNIVESKDFEFYCLDNVEVLDCHEVSIEEDYDGQSRGNYSGIYRVVQKRVYRVLSRLFRF